MISRLREPSSCMDPRDRGVVGLASRRCRVTANPVAAEDLSTVLALFDQIADTVAATGSRLTEVDGVGPVVSRGLLGRVREHPQRGDARLADHVWRLIICDEREQATGSGGDSAIKRDWLNPAANSSDKSLPEPATPTRRPPQQRLAATEELGLVAGAGFQQRLLPGSSDGITRMSYSGSMPACRLRTASRWFLLGGLRKRPLPRLIACLDSPTLSLRPASRRHGRRGRRDQAPGPGHRCTRSGVARACDSDGGR